MLMPSYEFAKEILPNIWIGTYPALTDMKFRNKHHIIRDIVITDPYSPNVKPKSVSKSSKSVTVMMTGNENELQRKKIMSKLFPIITDSFMKDRSLLISGTSWNSQHIPIMMLWCVKYGDMDISQVQNHFRSYI